MKKNTFLRQAALLGLLLPLQALADGPPKQQDLNNPIVQVFVIVIIILAICIGLLAHVLLGAAQFKTKQFIEHKKDNASAAAKIGSLLLLLTLGTSVFAAETPAAAAVVDDSIGGLTSSTFYGLLAVVLTELVILFGLVYNLKFLLKKEIARISPVEEESTKINWLKYWDKFNSLRPIKEEGQIDLGHNYDGIRELDNRLPPWWLYGFYACIVFAVIYLWRYEVSHTAPSSLEEFNIAMQKGADEKEAYLLKSASKVDENTVKFLNNESDLASGKAIFISTCAACHAADGGGLVGPNLTDDYWLHGGGVKDIFKTIKYGWQEKGMKSWKDDYTPLQIAQLTSYIKNLRGKTPAKAKEAQGDLFVEEEVKPAADTSKTSKEVSQPPVVEKKTTGK